MELQTIKEVKALKGKQVRDIRHPDHPLLKVTSVSNSYIRFNNGGIKMLINVFLGHSQQFYEVVEE